MLIAKAIIRQPEVMVLETTEEQDLRRERKTKPKVELLKVELDGTKCTTMVGGELTGIERAKIAELLVQNKSEFAWVLADMLGLNPRVAVHKLPIDPHAHMVVQEKRLITPKRQKAIVEEVDKLKVAKFIREAQFLTKLSSVVLVK